MTSCRLARLVRGGHRSILADARRRDMRDSLNRVKGREWFRPVAPMILAEDVHLYFDVPPGISFQFMSFAPRVRPRAIQEIPSGVHVDNTARVQTVGPSDCEHARKLLVLFKQQTGIPVVLNTSFNGPGEPIVETPLDAVRALIPLGLDALALGNYWIEPSSGYKGSSD